MIESEKYKESISKFDEANSQDPNKESVDGELVPKELLYSIRMTERLDQFETEANEALRLAVRCQHICRWEIPREDYEMNRAGYLKWRNDLKLFHSNKAESILRAVGYDEEIIENVKFLLEKKQLKKNEMTQALEDVVCLVFLEFYFEKFSEKYAEDKLTDILRKTWNKMSVKGQESAMQLELSDESKSLISKAIS